MLMDIICRESFSIRDREENFYMIGSMGLASSIGLGVALCQPNHTVIVLDGDGNCVDVYGHACHDLQQKLRKTLFTLCLTMKCMNQQESNVQFLRRFLWNRLPKAAGYRQAVTSR